jgi:hypothetical protein
MLVAACSCFMFGAHDAAFAIEPPLTVPNGGPPPPGPNAISVDGWNIYPAIDFLAEYSSNYFLGTQDKIRGWGLGISPSVTAEWSNGIHTTTLFGYFDHTQFPTENSIDSDDGEATFTQRYAPLRDLSFTFIGDYVHRTIAPGLTNAISTPTATTASSALPNGNILLPNGTIIAPNGTVVGQNGAVPNVTGLLVVNPFDQFTGNLRAEKLFAGGVLDVGVSYMDTVYDKQVSQSEDFKATTFNGDAAFWLGPVFYAYADGSFSNRQNVEPNPDSNAYRVIGGIGTRQVGLFSASIYGGYQGTETAGGGNSQGPVYGGVLTYFALPNFTIKGTIDETTNISQQTTPSTEALTLGAPTIAQVPISSSARITATALQPQFIINPKWTLSGLFGYTRIDYIGSSGFENAWLADAQVKYSMWRNLALTLEYQYSAIVSNVPQSTANRNLILMRATYQF